MDDLTRLFGTQIAAQVVGPGGGEAPPSPSAQRASTEKLKGMLGISSPAPSSPSSSAPSSGASSAASTPSKAPPSSSAAAPSRSPRVSSPSPATRFSGARFEAPHVSLDVDSRPLQGLSARVTPITKVKSKYAYYLGSLVAASPSFVCYVVKTELIRVINSSTLDKMLFKGHSQQVFDVQFQPSRPSVLASVGQGGKLFVWDASLSSDDHVQLEISAEGADEEYWSRVQWHPTLPNMLAVSGGNSVKIFDLSKISDKRTTVGALALDAFIEIEVGSTVLDLSFEGGLLATSASDGTLAVWDWNEGSQVWEQPSAHGPEQMMHGVWFVRPEGWVPSDGPVLLTGGTRCSSLKLFSLEAKAELASFTFRASKALNESVAFYNHVAVDPSNSVAVVANAKSKDFYALHIARTGDRAYSFDCASRYTVVEPILSVRVYDAPSDELAIYCVQTGCIQMFNVSAGEVGGEVAGEQQRREEEETPSSGQDKADAKAMLHDAKQKILEQKKQDQADREAVVALLAPISYDKAEKNQKQPERKAQKTPKASKKSEATTPKASKKKAGSSTPKKQEHSAPKQEAPTPTHKKKNAAPAPNGATLDSDALAKLIGVAVAREMNRERARQDKALKAMEERLTQMIKGVERTLKQGPTSKGVESALSDAVRDSFRKEVAPRLEKAIGAALKQVPTSSPSASSSSSSKSAGGAGGSFELGELKGSIKMLESVSQQLTKSVLETQRKITEDHWTVMQRALLVIEGAASSSGSHEGVPATPPTDKGSDPAPLKKQLTQLLEQDDLEQAFTRVLSLKDLGWLSWLLGRVDPAVLEPGSLSQPVLLSLVQQLGHNLEDTEDEESMSLKLTWLRQSLLVLDPSADSISMHSNAVLASLLDHVKQVYPVWAMTQVKDSIMLVSHVINSLLR